MMWHAIKNVLVRIRRRKQPQELSPRYADRFYRNIVLRHSATLLLLGIPYVRRPMSKERWTLAVRAQKRGAHSVVTVSAKKFSVPMGL